MVEPFGTTIGAISLAFHVFGICLDAFQLFQTAQNLGSDGMTFSCQLKLEEHRLLLWAQKSGLLQDTLDPRLPEKLIRETMTQLRELLSNVSVLKSKYKLELESTSNPDDVPDEPPLNTPLEFLNSEEIARERKNIIIRARAVQKASWFPRRLIWAKKDGKGLKYLI